MNFLERRFELTARGTTLGREILAGGVSFATLSYILFVQPAILSAAGMDPGAVMVATCVASAFATILLALTANHPIVLAPAMGHNVFFAFAVCGPVAMKGMGFTWQQALAANFVAGAIFLALSAAGLQRVVLKAVPDSLKHAMAVGIGLLIAMIGLQWSGLVVDAPATLVGLGDLGSGPVLLSLFGLVVIGGLSALRVRGAILLGLLATLGAGLLSGAFGGPELVVWQGLVGPVPDPTPTLLALDFGGLLGHGLTAVVAVVLIFVFLDLFDTMGTLVGLSHQAGLVRDDGSIPGDRAVYVADAAGTLVGAAMGTSTVTSYVESAAGIAEGGRTGLTGITAGILFLVSLFLYPLVKMVGMGLPQESGAVLYPVIAPVLIVIGGLMMKSVRAIDWEDPVVALPSFLTIILMPLTFSITEGIGFGFMACSALALLSGRWREVPPVFHAFSILFVLRYVFL